LAGGRVIGTEAPAVLAKQRFARWGGAVALSAIWLAVLVSAALAVQESIAGDADCDGQVSERDLIQIEAELADGDGAEVADAGGGTVASCSGADANGDGIVSAADLSTTLAFLYGHGTPAVATGPQITFLGIASGDGSRAEPIRPGRVPTYQSAGGFGFVVVVEAAPGTSGAFPSQRLTDSEPGNPLDRPGLQVVVDRSLGDGSREVCDQGGVPATSPPSFAPDPAITQVLKDIACRFFSTSNQARACTTDQFGVRRFTDPRSRVQYCMSVTSFEAFPTGSTLVTVRALDIQENVGATAQAMVHIGTDPLPTSTPTATQTLRPTPLPTRTTTPSPTQTRVPSSTPTRTPTATLTPRFSPTATPTRTGIATPTRSATIVPTLGATPTRTHTGTSSPTRTGTPRATSTGTSTPRPGTPTATGTRTATATRTRTATRTHTVDPSASPTRTTTATRTRTMTRTPSVTLVPTHTQTHTPSRTATHTQTHTPSRTATRTLTATRTGTPTPSRTATRTATPTSTWTRTATITVTRTVTRTPTVTLTRTVTRTPTPTRRPGADVTFVGVARGDFLVDEVGTVDGLKVFERPFGFNFSLVVEAKPGPSGRSVKMSTFDRDAGNPSVRPGLEIIVSRALGNGSTAVCDRTLPNVGGVPASASFDDTQAISDAINDFACRFVDGQGNPRGRAPSEACTVFRDGTARFRDGTSTVQFCGLIESPAAFPVGDTRVSVRVRDVSEEPGPAQAFIVRVLP
jgi:hypothetical protein